MPKKSDSHRTVNKSITFSLSFAGQKRPVVVSRFLSLFSPARLAFRTHSRFRGERKVFLWVNARRFGLSDVYNLRQQSSHTASHSVLLSLPFRSVSSFSRMTLCELGGAFRIEICAVNRWREGDGMLTERLSHPSTRRRAIRATIYQTQLCYYASKQRSPSIGAAMRRRHVSVRNRNGKKPPASSFHPGLGSASNVRAYVDLL